MYFSSWTILSGPTASRWHEMHAGMTRGSRFSISIRSNGHERAEYWDFEYFVTVCVWVPRAVQASREIRIDARMEADRWLRCCLGLALAILSGSDEGAKVLDSTWGEHSTYLSIQGRTGYGSSQ